MRGKDVTDDAVHIVQRDKWWILSDAQGHRQTLDSYKSEHLVRAHAEGKEMIQQEKLRQRGGMLLKKTTYIEWFVKAELTWVSCNIWEESIH